MIVTACPATVIAPERAIVVGATVMLTEPMPDPAAPAVIVIHATALEAVHVQLVPDVTDTVWLLPVADAVTEDGVTV